MQSIQKIIFKNLKGHISDAIKQSCYRSDGRLYNIANEVHNIVTFSLEAEIELAQGLSKIFDKTIKDSISVDCDLSVIVQGLLLGAFRSSPFKRDEAHQTIQILAHEILQLVFKYKGDEKQTIEGLLAATVIIAMEYKLTVHDAVFAVKEGILTSAQAIDPKLAEESKKIISTLNDA